MFIRWDRSEPIYQQLYRQIRESILRGELAPGARLPATRILATDAGVSRNTVLLAYDQLRAEGYVDGQVGAGTFVARDLPDSAPHPPLRSPADMGAARAVPKARLSAYAHRAQMLEAPTMAPIGSAIRFNFRYGLPSVAGFPRSTWRKLVAREAHRLSAETSRYGDTAGLPRLRQVLADYLRRARAVACDPDHILIVNGSQQALDLIARTLIDPGAAVLIENPHYLGAREVFRAAGARLVPCRVDADGLDINAAPKAASYARLAYVTPSHQFPGGAVMPLARRLALLAWARSTNAYVVEDDYDSEFRYDGRPIESVQALDRDGYVIYVGTMSKTLFPSLRIGFLVVPPALRKSVLAIKHLSDQHTSGVLQSVLADFIGEGHFERHVRRMRKQNAERRAALLQALHDAFGEAAVIQGASAGLHLTLRFPDVAEARTKEIIETARSVGVAVYSVSPYYVRTPKSAGLLLGYAALSPQEIRSGILRLGQAFDRTLANGPRQLSTPSRQSARRRGAA
jgi:GntR family transcriptional regulator/MocR family aminotransferase